MSIEMKILKSIVISIVIISSSFIYGQDESRYDRYKGIAEEIVKTALVEKKGYNYLEQLCKIGPRLSGSENSLKAIYWAKDKMEKLGFDSVWLQSVMVPHWVRGNVEKVIISKSKYFINGKLAATALGGSIGTDRKGITAKLIEVGSFKELKNFGDKVKGKIIFINHRFSDGNLDPFRSYGETAGERITGPVECSKYGAVATIVRSLTADYDNVPHTGVTGKADSVKQIPSVAIGLKDADLLSEALKKDPQLEVNIKLSCKNENDTQSFNVIGEIKGAEKPNDIIVVGAHIDSWDVACGAHDDGAGFMQVLECLDLLKRIGIKPESTIRCVLYINEENGSRGAREYEKFAEVSHEKHIAAIESDRGAFTPREFYVDSDSLTLEKIKSWLPLLEKSGIDWIKKGGSGADVGYIKSCIAKLGYASDSKRYFNYHHSANDTIEAVNPREMELGSVAITIMTLMLSNEL
jgi:carboxypeptidase Q